MRKYRATVSMEGLKKRPKRSKSKETEGKGRQSRDPEKIV
jgi:hypothetical protein